MIESIGAIYQVLFLFFIFFIQIALFNILTGIFVEHALKLAQPDHESMAFEQRKNELVEMQELARLCRKLDDNDDGAISLDEFHSGLTDNLKAFFTVMSLDITDATMFFEMLASRSEDNEVDIEAFVAGCMRLKGLATSLDLQTLMFETKLLHKQQREFHVYVGEHLQRITEQVGDLQVRQGPVPASQSKQPAGEAAASTKAAQPKSSASEETSADPVAPKTSMNGAAKHHEVLLEVASHDPETTSSFAANPQDLGGPCIDTKDAAGYSDPEFKGQFAVVKDELVSAFMQSGCLDKIYDNPHPQTCAVCKSMVEEALVEHMCIICSAEAGIHAASAARNKDHSGPESVVRTDTRDLELDSPSAIAASGDGACAESLHEDCIVFDDWAEETFQDV